MTLSKKKNKSRHLSAVSSSKFAQVAAVARQTSASSFAAVPPVSDGGSGISPPLEPSSSSPSRSGVPDLSLDQIPVVDPIHLPVVPPAPLQEALASPVDTSVPNSAAVEGSSSGAVPGDPSATLDAQESQHRKWASIVKSSGILDAIGTPSKHISGVPFVMIPDPNIESAKEEFKDFVFARFHGDAPEMGRIIGIVNAIWARVGPRIFVHRIGQSIFLLRVMNSRTRDIILSRNMWNIAGYPMFVAPWSPEFSPEVPPLTSAVVPVEFRNVPYLLFKKESLSRIATAVGHPVKLAPETERKENFEVAKVYVRIDLQAELPSKVMSGFSNGKEILISILYPWMPVKCSACGM
ncbi:hypothetical protein EUTSA_v10017828mg, partial [Eutrema salsugineum]